MRKRSDVYDLGHLNSCAVNGADSALATVARTFDVGLNLTQTQIISDLCAILRGHLSGVRCVLLRASEAHLARGRPGYHLTLTVGQTHNNVVERAMHMQLALAIYLYIPLFRCDCLFAIL